MSFRRWPGMLPALLALLLGVPAAAQQQAPPNREVLLQNETDLALREFYLAAPGAADRGPDRLGADMVAPGAGYRIRLGRTNTCVYDAIAVFQDNSEDVRRRVDLCRTPRLVYGDPALPTLDIAVANRSQVVLQQLYASTRGAEAWGPDRLGAETIAPGGSFRMRLRSRDCVFDLRAIYDDGREETRPRVNLCESRAIAFDRSGIPRPPRRSLLLSNRHLAPVQEAYLSPSTEGDWGPDRLGSAILAPGDDMTIEMEGGCEADLRIVFPNGGAEERREVNICETPRIVLRPGWVVADRLDEEEGAPEELSGGLRLRNAGPLPIVEVYTPLPGGPRGEDRLGTQILPVGDILELPPPDANACAADVVAVFRDGREVTQAGIDLCAGEEIEVR
jgi:hypothetical protein